MAIQYIKLDDILTPSQIKSVEKKIKQLNDAGHSHLSLEFTVAMKEYFRKHENYLLNSGFRPDYIVSLLIYILHKNNGKIDTDCN